MHRHLILLLVCWPATTSVANADSTLTPQRFESLRQLIRPQADESRSATVPWLINLQEARQRAVKEDKPLLLWRSGGGDVLGRT